MFSKIVTSMKPKTCFFNFFSEVLSSARYFIYPFWAESHQKVYFRKIILKIYLWNMYDCSSTNWPTLWKKSICVYWELFNLIKFNFYFLLFPKTKLLLHKNNHQDYLKSYNKISSTWKWRNKGEVGQEKRI